MGKLLKHKENIGIFFILILAAYLRLYRIADYMTFLGDEGRDALVVYNILHGHFTLLGPTSSVGGFFLGPIYYYFMAPFLLAFNYNPVGPAVMVALFGILTVWFVYKIGSEFFSPSVGLIGAFLYAISPVVIAYSRSSWNPNLMPFFTMLSLYTTYTAVKKNNTKLFALCGIFLGILIQLHYLATFVGAIVGIYIFIAKYYTKKQFSPSWMSIFLQSVQEWLSVFAGFLIGVSPFLLFEARHKFPNTISIAKFIFHSKDVSGTSSFFSTVQNVFFRLFGRLVTNFPPPEQVSVQAHQNLLFLYVFTWVLAGVSFLYFLHVFYKSVRERDERFLQVSLVFVWFVVGILLFGFYRKQIYDYYFEFLFPLPFLLIGLVVTRFWNTLLLRVVGVVVLCFLAYTNLQASPFNASANQQLLQAETIAKFVNDKTNGKPYNFALITGGNSDHEYRYFLTEWHHPPVEILNTVIDPKRKSITEQLLIVCEMNPCHPLGDSLWEIAGFGRSVIVGHWDVSVVQVYRLMHFTGDTTR